MSERPRPEYGEYATPQEQAAAIRASGGVPPSSPDALAGADRADPHTLRAPDAAAADPRAMAGARVAPAAAKSSRMPAGMLNRFVTILLLAIGFFSVFQSAPGYLNFGTTVQAFYAQQGIGTYEVTSLTATLGVVMLVVQAVIWLATASVSIVLLRAGKLSWWVPIVGAVVAFASAATVVAVLLLADPAFIEYIGSAPR